MPLNLIFPPKGSPLLDVPESRDGELHLVEAWPGSIEHRYDEQFDIHYIFGHALAASGGLPDGHFAFIHIVALDRVEEMRKKHKAGKGNPDARRGHSAATAHG